MKGANNTHILEDRTYYFYVRVNIMPEQLLEKFKVSTNVLEKGILQLGFAIKILKFTTPTKQTKTSK